MCFPCPGKSHHSCRAGLDIRWCWSRTGGQCSQGGSSMWKRLGHPYRCHSGRGQSSIHWCQSHSAALCNLDRRTNKVFMRIMAMVNWREAKMEELKLENAVKVIVWCTFSTFAGVLVGTIGTLCSILTRRAGALINVHLTQTPRKTCRCIEQNREFNFSSD